MHTRTTAVLAAVLTLALLPPPARGHSGDLCPESSHCTKDAQCNDGDPCTRDLCEFLGETDGCCEHEPVAPCLDTFLCYDVVESPPASRFVPIPDVTVVDPVEQLVVTLASTRQLCTPADRDGAGTHDARTQLERYRTVPGARSAAARTVKVDTALGTVLLDGSGADTLLVPALTASGTVPSPPGRSGVDDLKCRAVKLAATSPAFVKGRKITLGSTLNAPGSLPRTFKVGPPVQLCTAADVGGDGFADACAAVLCYRVKAAGDEPNFSPVRDLWARDRFALRRLDAVKEDVACLPAVVADRTCSERGFFCESDRECRTGHCVDGVCCESACDGPCDACAAGATGQPHGICAPVPGCTPPR